MDYVVCSSQGALPVLLYRVVYRMLNLWIIISKAVLQQIERDRKIDRLVNTMNDVYAFVHDAEPLKAVKCHESTLACMAQQTTQCAVFIRDYVKHKDFCTPSFTP